MTNSAVKSPYLRTSYCLFWERVCNALYLVSYAKGWYFFLSSHFLEDCLRCPLYSGLKFIQQQTCFLSLLFVESLSGLEDFVFNYIFPTMVSKQLFFRTSQILCFYVPLVKNNIRVSYTAVFEAPYLQGPGLNTTCQVSLPSISQSRTEGFIPNMIGRTVLRKDTENWHLSNAHCVPNPKSQKAAWWRKSGCRLQLVNLNRALVLLSPLTMWPWACHLTTINPSLFT